MATAQLTQPVTQPTTIDPTNEEDDLTKLIKMADQLKKDQPQHIDAINNVLAHKRRDANGKMVVLTLFFGAPKKNN